MSKVWIDWIRYSSNDELMKLKIPDIPWLSVEEGILKLREIAM